MSLVDPSQDLKGKCRVTRGGKGDRGVVDYGEEETEGSKELIYFRKALS